MASTKHRGFEGFLYYKTGAGTNAKLASLTGYELSIKAAEVDATDHDSGGWGDKLDGYREWSVSVDFIYLDAEATQAGLVTAVLAGATDIIVQLRDIDVTAALMWTGTCRITDFKSSVKGAVAQTHSVTLSGRGPLAQTAITAGGTA